VGLVSPFADDAGALWESVCDGRAPGRRQPELALDGMPGPLAAPHVDFDARAELGREGLRPLDRTGRLASVAAKRALEDSGWSTEALEDHEVGLVLGTLFGSLRTISGFDRRGVSAGPSYAKPLDFVNSVINAAAGQTAIRFNLRGTNATISGDLTSGLQALGYAADLIRGGRARALLAGGADELCVESLYGFHKLGLLCREDAERAVPLGGTQAEPSTGMVLAEAAALLMLESLESARRRGATILAEILGHGAAFDPSQGAREGLAAAMADATRNALRDADRPASAIHCLSLGANGTHLDEREAAGLWRALGMDSPIPTFAGKSGTGETLGSSGALQTVLAIESLRRGRIPGTPGSPTATRSGLALSRETSSVDGSAALVSAVGLQGKAAALVAEIVQ
jgi:3-oxoacyl-[acyl-carrier-protein] synthase II